MVVIGAAIGGLTNSLAIKMLFRPYKAMYIGKMKVPFTPGLIPKRREELAVQMGRMVVEHLLTAEGIRKKFQDPNFREDMVGFGKQEIERIFHLEKNIEEFLTQIGFSNATERTKEKLQDLISNRISEMMNENRSKTIHELLPQSLLQKLDTKVPVVSNYIIARAVDFFESQEGKERLRTMIDDFLDTRGALGNMVQMFLGNESLVNKVQPEIIKFLKNEGTEEMLTQIIEKEWSKLKNWRLDKAEGLVGSETLRSMITDKIIGQIPISAWMNKPIGEVVSPFREFILDRAIPVVVDFAGEFIAGKIEVMMERLHIAEIVKNQVESFSVGRLEEMVLSISKREFKMITYLGALLGGLIGFVQGFLVIFIQ